MLYLGITRSLPGPTNTCLGTIVKAAVAKLAVPINSLLERFFFIFILNMNERLNKYGL